MKKITLIGGIAVMAMSLTFLSSCKKEEITSKKPVSQSGNQYPAKHEYKFSSIAKIPGENPENGFLSVKVSSNDEAFMRKYVAKLEQTKIVMQEASSTKQDEKDSKPLFDENESKSGVELNFDWNNFSFEREKGKIYKVCVKGTDESKSLVLYNAFTSASFSSNWCYATVNIYSQYSYGCTWYFNNTVNDFYSKSLNYHDNLEVRCFQMSGPFQISGYSSFTINGYKTYYRPRFNYVSPELPSGYFDVNAIISGYGYAGPFIEPIANITLYIAG